MSLERRLKRTLSTAMAAAVTAWVIGCATDGVRDPRLLFIDTSVLPSPDITLNIARLGPCTDHSDRSLHLRAHQPVTVLVHGSFGSPGQLRGLAQALAFHGQQAVCFTYNDRDRLRLSSGALTSALEQLARQMRAPDMTVIGHSQGALIARRSLVADRPFPFRNPDLQLRLVTVSGPFSGIASAEPCGNRLLQVLTLGLIGVTCQLATGDKWNEITSSSNFILQPGPLHRQVREYLKIVTDERGACRRIERETCVETDAVFSLDEQRHPIIDRAPITQIEKVEAGHVEIVGDERVWPDKLLAILERHGMFHPAEPDTKIESASPDEETMQRS